MRKKCAIASLLALAWTIVATADDWPAARVRNVFGEDGRHFVRIIPGRGFGDTVGFTGQPSGPYARGEFYTRRPNRSYALVADVALQNPVSPADALVTNNGYLVTFDNWHNLGYGKVVAIYDPSGLAVGAFTLEQLYTADQIEQIPRSVSSRWWRCAPHGFVDPHEQTEIYVFERFGGTFTFTIKNGTVAYHAGQATCTPPGGPFSASWFGR